MSDAERSRIARAASALTGRSEEQLLEDLDAAQVAIVAEEGAAHCQLAGLMAVRIALLTYGYVTLVSPTGADELAAKCRALATQLRPGEAALDIRSAVPRNVDGVLRIGYRIDRDYRSVTVASDGWVMRMAAANDTGGIPVTELPAGGRRNEIVEIGAACVGMGELWLRVLGVPRSECCFEWSLLDYTTAPIGTLGIGPDMPDEIVLSALQVGAGTVGGGFDLALATLPVHGHLAIVDIDYARTENFGPHPLVAKGQKKTEKVQLARKLLESELKGRVNLFTKREWYSFFKLRIGNEVQKPDVVISAVDKVRPRHDLQKLWAPLHIDLAATAGVQCQVIVRTNPGSGLCLIGFFDAGDERREEDELAELTGLAAEGFSAPTRSVTDDDIHRAPAEKRVMLADALRRGQRWCNVALAASMGATRTDPNFVGSAPHNAILAGALGAGELVKARGLGLDRDGTFVQWHAVSRQCLVMRSRCQPHCECASVLLAV